MKNMKKLFSLALALVMMMALVVTAGATSTTPAEKSITMTNAAAGNTYTIYKLFDAEYNGSNGVTYSIDKEANATWYNLVNGEGSPFDATAKKGTTGEVYYVTVKDNTEEATVINWLKENYTKGNLTEGEVKDPSADGKITWTLDSYGYYLIASVNDAKGSAVAVTIDTNAPHATVIAKNEKPGWGNGSKTMNYSDSNTDETTNSANIGESIDFRIYTNGAKNYDGQNPITQYVIHDNMNGNLDWDGTVVVKVNGKTLATDKYSLLTKSTSPAVGEGYTFEVVIPWGTVTKDSNGKDVYTPTYTEVNNTIEITYKATVKSTAPANTALTNTAKISWNNEKIEDPGKETATYVYDFEIFKYTKNGDVETQLENAQFTLKKGDETLKFTELKDDTTDPNKVTGYKYDKNGTVETLVAGKIDVVGLEAGTYTLTETQAPNGYNKLAAPITIKIDQKITKDDDGKVTKVEKLIYVDNSTEANGETVKVLNSTGTELPSTGGIGTTIFTVTGAILMIGAAVLFLTKKRSEA